MIKSWNGVTVAQYNEIQNLSLEDEDNYTIELLSILTDKSIDDVEDLSMDEYELLLKQSYFISNPPKGKAKDVLQIGEDIKLYKLDLSTLSVGAFIDLENLIGSNFKDNFNTILSILYRCRVKESTPLFKAEYEEYGNWIFHRKPLFDTVRITEVYSTLSSYLTFRNHLFDSYSGLFNSEDDDEDEEVVDVTNETPHQRKERDKAEVKTTTIKKWGWDSLLIKLASGDILKIDDVTKLPIIQAFNTLSIKKELNLE